MSGILASQELWIDEICERLLEGERIFVHAPPRMGKTFLARAIESRLGATAQLIRGATFTEENQLMQRENLREVTVRAVETHGNAQLVFDDYHSALRRSQGQRLQSNLVSLLIDGVQSRDIGAVFFARCMTPVHLPGRGSPLVSRCVIVPMPRWESTDVAQLNIEEDEVDAAVGSSASLLAQAVQPHRLGLEALTRRLDADAASVLDDLPTNSVLTLAGRQVTAQLSDFEWRALDGLYRKGKGPTILAEAANLVDLAAQRNSGWPADLDSSAKQFAQLLDGRESAIWSDRYLFKSLTVLHAFVAAVRTHTAARLLLLGTERPGLQSVPAAEIKSFAETVQGVECRLMMPADRRGLHDRHLALKGEPGGWVLPTADVVTGLVQSGSAVATRAPRFGIDYDEVWQRSRTV